MNPRGIEEGIDEENENAGRGMVLNVERFLESCEDIALGGDDKGKEDLAPWRTSQRFHRYVESLEDKVEDLLSTLQGHVDGHRELYARGMEVRRRVGILSDMLEPVVMPSGGPNEGDTQRHSGVSVQDALKIVQHYDIAKPSMGLSHGTRVPELEGNRVAAAGSASIPKTSAGSASIPKSATGSSTKESTSIERKRSFQPISISEAAKSRLEKQSKVQEALTDDLADLASALKESTLAVQTKVQARDALLSDTGDALETSVQGTRTSVARVEKARKQSRMNFCFTMLVIFVLVLGCAAMIVFIRVTTFVGYHTDRSKSKHTTEEDTVITTRNETIHSEL